MEIRITRRNRDVVSDTHGTSLLGAVNHAMLIFQCLTFCVKNPENL